MSSFDRGQTLAVILAGGLGTRLRAMFSDRPKALVPVAGKPFLARQLEWLGANGFARAHIAAGYCGDQIEAWAAEWNRAGRVPRLTVSREPQPLGTGGGLKFAEPWTDGEWLWVFNGDSLAPNADFQCLEKTAEKFSNVWKSSRESFPMFGKNSEKFSNVWKNLPPDFPNIGNVFPAVLAVVPVPSAGRYGTVEFDGQGRILAFREKAQREQGWVNAGIYLLRRALLSVVRSEVSFSLETELFPDLARMGGLLACPISPPLLDMGTPEGWAEMEKYFRAHPARDQGESSTSGKP